MLLKDKMSNYFIKVYKKNIKVSKKLEFIYMAFVVITSILVGSNIFIFNFIVPPLFHIGLFVLLAIAKVYIKRKLDKICYQKVKKYADKIMKELNYLSGQERYAIELPDFIERWK